jgi:hypothetical protein
MARDDEKKACANKKVYCFERLKNGEAYGVR